MDVSPLYIHGYTNHAYIPQQESMDTSPPSPNLRHVMEPPDMLPPAQLLLVPPAASMDSFMPIVATFPCTFRLLEASPWKQLILTIWCDPSPPLPPSLMVHCIITAGQLLSCPTAGSLPDDIVSLYNVNYFYIVHYFYYTHCIMCKICMHYPPSGVQSCIQCEKSLVTVGLDLGGQILQD